MSGESEAATKNNERNPPLKSLGKYLIDRKLGQGGMGTVYLAKHTGLKKLVALKVLPQDKAKNPTLVKRFKSEAEAAAVLEHPNIVAVFDSGEADGYLYIAMEYVEGIDLFEQVKRRGVIPVKRSIEIIKQVASALQHAFEHSIVHRDIKPSNLLLRRDGVVKVTDLGLARSIDDTLETNITRAGTTVGTVDYMAPEQARNSKAADIRSDIYSLGCTWYQMLTGEAPFSEGSLTNKLQAHAIKPLPDPRELNENIPEGLFAVLQRMTAKKPEDRYQTPKELLDDLAQSKLTKAAFSNEIFSDLSDYDIDATDDYSAEDDEEYDEDESPEDHAPKPKLRSRAEEDDDDVDVSEPRRRKTQAKDDDEPVRKKSHARDGDTATPVDEAQPLKSRNKSSSKSDGDQNDDVDDELRSSTRSPKRVQSDSDSDEPEGASTKRRRNPQGADDGKSSGNRPGKSSSANEQATKKTAKNNGPRQLPPKLQPTTSADEAAPKYNVEIVKYLAVIVGVLLIIGSLGSIIFRWSGQVDVLSQPVAIVREVPVNEVAAVAPVRPKSDSKDAKDSKNVSVNVAESAKTATADRPGGEFDIAKQPMPPWATSDASVPGDIPVITVGPGAGTETHFSNLDDALLACEKNGGYIKLMGDGPFLLSSIELKTAKKVVIAAATAQDQPLVIFKLAESGVLTGLVVNNGVLDLRGVNFVMDQPPGSTSPSNSMISVFDGQLFVRNCSFTESGNNAGVTTAMSVLSKQDLQNVPTIDPQVLLDRVIVRGNGLAGLQINRTYADVVIKDSLFVTGVAPAVNVSGRLLPNAADSITSKPRRLLRVLRTTFCARKEVFEIACENTLKPPTTSILLQDSVCSAEGAGNTAVLVSATGWPSVTSPSGGWLTNLNWTSLSSLYLGFERLLDLDKTSFQVTGLETWQRVWGKRFEPTQFQQILWQESSIPELSSIQPHDFDNSKLPYRDVKTTNGGLPGCPVSSLRVPGVISQSRLVAMSQRHKVPAIVKKPTEPTQVKKVDMLKEDFGLILNRNDWQSGTVFELTGFGIRTMSPAKISGKSLRIVIRQTDGAPLKIQPRISDQKSKPDNPGLINIENGLLDFQSVAIESVQTPKSAAPPWLIHAKNASVILRGCQLSGPLQQDLDQHQGLIQWTTTSAFQPPAGTEPPFLSVNNSVLMTTGLGIRAECAQGHVFIENCIMAIRGYGLELIPIRIETKMLSTVDLDHVTFSTSKAAIRVEASAGTEPVSLPMKLFVDDCVLVPPLEFKAGEATDSAILECVGPVREEKQIEWWGTSNGIAKEIKYFLRQSDADSITSISGWQSLWGDSNDFRLLTGIKGVKLTANLPNKWANLKATSFSLDPHSPGATWAIGGRPLGADLRAIEDSVKRAPTDSKPGAMPAPSAAGGAPATGAKKTLGF